MDRSDLPSASGQTLQAVKLSGEAAAYPRPRSDIAIQAEVYVWTKTIPRSYFSIVIIHVCGSDGEQIGQLEENEFREGLFGGRFPADSYYWHEGMEDWHPVADYRSLAKTQRISFTPPMTRTVKINLEAPAKPKPQTGLGRLGQLWNRLTGGKGKT